MVKQINQANHPTDDPELWWKMKQQYEAEKKDGENEDEARDSNTPDSNTPVSVLERKALSFFSHFKIQLIVAIIIFISFVILQKIDMDKPLKFVSWVEAEMNNDIPFVKISQWYEQTFAGSPAFIPTFDNKSQQVMSKNESERYSLPVHDGLVVRSFADSLTGIEISTKTGSTIHTIADGRVVFVRDEADTIIVQHSDSFISIYSKLAATEVKLNQSVEAGERIGRMSLTQQTPLLFFGIKKDDQYIDPLGVVTFE